MWQIKPISKKIVFSLLTLLFGILIYYLYREQLLTKQDLISSFIRNYVPDFLWIISFYSISTVFSKEITNNYIMLTFIYVVSFGVFFEFLQLTGVVSGTYDVFDIMTYIISAIIASLAEKYCWREKI